MNGLCHESRPAGSHEVKHERSGRGPCVVRANTSRGAWANLYEVGPDGSCHLLGQTTRWVPRALARSRAFAALGVRKAAA
jgi:hypothetical protein